MSAIQHSSRPVPLPNVRRSARRIRWNVARLARIALVAAVCWSGVGAASPARAETAIPVMPLKKVVTVDVTGVIAWEDGDWDGCGDFNFMVGLRVMAPSAGSWQHLDTAPEQCLGYASVYVPNGALRSKITLPIGTTKLRVGLFADEDDAVGVLSTNFDEYCYGQVSCYENGNNDEAYGGADVPLAFGQHTVSLTIVGDGMMLTATAKVTVTSILG
jgi:hypothetical protein